MSLRDRISLPGIAIRGICIGIPASVYFHLGDSMQNIDHNLVTSFVTERMPMIQQKAGEIGESLANGSMTANDYLVTFAVSWAVAEGAIATYKGYDRVRNSGLAQKVGSAAGRMRNVVSRG